MTTPNHKRLRNAGRMLCTLLKSVTVLKNLFGGLLEIFQNMDFNLHFRKIGRKKSKYLEE